MRRQVVRVGGLVQLNVGVTNNVHVVLGIYVKVIDVSN